MPIRLTTWLACWLLSASAQATGLADPPGPAAAAGCSAFIVGPCAPRNAATLARAGALPPEAQARTGPMASTPVPASTPAPTPALTTPATPSDADIERHLANHGKPPREVARALLDPSDANIAAMMRRLQRDQAVAAYVGQRMTELAQSDPSLVVAGGAAPDDLPALTGLRLVLVTRPDCTACDRAAQALQQLVAAYPTLDARVAVTGARDAQHIVQQMARTGVTLPTAAAGDALLARFDQAPPYLLVADVRQQREGLLAAADVDASQLRQALLVFRRAAQAPPRKE